MTWTSFASEEIIFTLHKLHVILKTITRTRTLKGGGFGLTRPLKKIWKRCGCETKITFLWWVHEETRSCLMCRFSESSCTTYALEIIMQSKLCGLIRMWVISFPTIIMWVPSFASLRQFLQVKILISRSVLSSSKLEHSSKDLLHFN